MNPRAPAVAFVVIYSAVYAAVGLFPFDFDVSRTPRFYSFGSWRDLIDNIIAFLPFGFAFAAVPLYRRPRLGAASFCAVLALSIESLQVFVPQRFPQISDIVCNSAGGWFGAWLWLHAARRRSARPIAELPTRRSRSGTTVRR